MRSIIAHGQALKKKRKRGGGSRKKEKRKKRSVLDRRYRKRGREEKARL